VTAVDARTVGRHVFDLRVRLGLTVVELADRAGVGEATVYQLERGANPDCALSTVTGLAAALGVPVGVLLGERRPPAYWPVDRLFWRQAGREIDELRARAVSA
jgi:DNA-binding XRE family transcriptional regulator